MEDLDAYFASSPGSRSVATTAGVRSTIKKASRRDYAKYDEEQYGEEDQEMQDEEGASTTACGRMLPQH